MWAKKKLICTVSDFSKMKISVYEKIAIFRQIFAFSSLQLLSHVRLFATSWSAARQASRSITNSRSSLRLTSIKSVMPSSHLSLCRPLLLLPPIPSSIRVFSNESTLRMRWPKYWSFSFSIIPSKEIPGLISFRMGCQGWGILNWTLPIGLAGWGDRGNDPVPFLSILGVGWEVRTETKRGKRKTCESYLRLPSHLYFQHTVNFVLIALIWKLRLRSVWLSA